MGAETQDNAEPIETPAATPSEQPSAPAEQAAGAETPKPERDEGGRYRKPVQPRIDELTRDVHSARRESEYWKNRATAAEAKANPPAPEKTKPTPDQFETYDAYVEALTDYKADERVSKKFAERDENSAKAKTEETRQSNWVKSVEAAKAKHADYDDVMSHSQVNVSQHVTELLLDSEFGGELAYYLDRNPDVADRLNGLTPTQAAREIGRIEAKLSAEAPTPTKETSDEVVPTPPPAPAKPKTSAAPPPARPATPAGQGGSPPLAKMGMDDYVKTRKAQGATWARR